MAGPGPADQASDWFAECYGARPEGIWHAPGRVNLIGEHTDYNEGFVLPFALGQGVRAAASRRDDGMLELRSRQPPGGTSVAIDADLERGAALSSSAALECATALALTELHGLSVPRPRLAAIARRAENEFAGIPTGIMDQSASLLCRAGHALLLDCRSGETSDVPFDLPAAGLVLLVIDTRVRHALADGRYAARRRACEQAARALGVGSLRDVTDGPGALDAIADPVLRRRARHVITENGRVLAAVALLRAGDIAGCGTLLSASHRSLRYDFEVSWPQADAAVDAAVAAGALGARMTGGGFGGSIIALARARTGPDVRADVCDAFARRGWPQPGFLEALPSAGALRLR